MTAVLFIAPAAIAYAAFVLVPLCMSVYYSLLRWDGILSLTGPNNAAASVSVAAPNPESVQLEYGQP